MESSRRAGGPVPPPSLPATGGQPGQRSRWAPDAKAGRETISPVKPRPRGGLDSDANSSGINSGDANSSRADSGGGETSSAAAPARVGPAPEATLRGRWNYADSGTQSPRRDQPSNVSPPRSRPDRVEASHERTEQTNYVMYTYIPVPIPMSGGEDGGAGSA